MLGMFLSLAIFLANPQSEPSAFYVERVEAQTKYDSTYILERAGVILPPDKMVGVSDVECLVNELKASGIFADVRARLIPTGPRTRRLVLTCVYSPKVQRFTIEGVALDNLPDVDVRKFKSALQKRDLTPGTHLMTYFFRSLEDRVNAAFGEALPEVLARDYSGRTWITIRPVSRNRVRLVVSADFTGCKLLNRTPSLPK
jgi:hypothetical protein